MNQHETFVLPRAERRGRRAVRSAMAPALAGTASVAVAYVFRRELFADLHNIPLTAILFLWLFGTMMWCAFSVVRHAEAIAERLGEPYGTLVLTLSMVVIEVSLLAAIMLHGENNATLARDAMFATLMIVLNGMVGAALLMGAMRYWEQEYNLAGARAFLVVIASLAVFALIIPNYTKTAPDPSEAPMKAMLFASITVLFYVVFVVIQTVRHRAFFAEPAGNGTRLSPCARGRLRAPRSASMSRCSWSPWCPSCCWRNSSPSSSISASRTSLSRTRSAAC